MWIFASEMFIRSKVWMTGMLPFNNRERYGSEILRSLKISLSLLNFARLRFNGFVQFLFNPTNSRLRTAKGHISIMKIANDFNFILFEFTICIYFFKRLICNLLTYVFGILAYFIFVRISTVKIVIQRKLVLGKVKSFPIDLKRT